jgi:hypothetical protein
MKILSDKVSLIREYLILNLLLTIDDDFLLKK